MCTWLHVHSYIPFVTGGIGLPSIKISLLMVDGKISTKRCSSLFYYRSFYVG